MKSFLQRWSPWRLRARLERANKAWLADLAEFNDVKSKLATANEQIAVLKEFIGGKRITVLKEFIGGKQITREEAMRGLPTDAECEATRAEFKRKPL